MIGADAGRGKQPVQGFKEPLVSLCPSASDVSGTLHSMRGADRGIVSDIIANAVE